MPAAVPPNQELSPVAPSQNLTSSPVANVEVGFNATDAAPNEIQFKDLPPRAQTIVANISSPNNEQKLKAIDQIQQHDKESADYHPNQQPQWGKVFFSALQGRWGDVYKYYNGGAVKEEKARDVAGNEYWKSVNELGDINVVKDSKGRILGPKEKEELTKRGGIFSASDEGVLKTAPWVNASQNAKLAAQGLTSQLHVATNNAYNAARVAGGANKNIDEQLQLSSQISHVLDAVGNLPEEKRKKLLGLTQAYITNSANQSKGGEKRVGAQTGELTSTGTNANLGGSAGGATAGEGVPPTSGKVGGAVGVGSNTLGQNTSGGSAGETNTAANTSGQTNQIQQNLQAAIEQELQGVIRKEDFYKWIRLQALDQENQANYKNIPDAVKPPGWENIPDQNPQLAGSQAIKANRVGQQRNNALMAAWSNELYKAQRKQAETGETFDVDKLARDFQSSKIYEGINNTYANKLQNQLTGAEPKYEAGKYYVDPKTHKLIRASE
jgi:hypothetical protein